MTREEALDSVRDNVENENTVKHMLATEAIMRALAERLVEYCVVDTIPISVSKI